MILEFINYDTKEYIVQWSSSENWIPMKDDYVIMHNGDKKEHYIVVQRMFDGMQPNKIILIVKKVK